MSISDNFSNAGKVHSFSQSERAQIEHALTRYLEMKPEDCAILIQDIEQTGAFRVFGYGSLMGDPTAPPDKEFRGTLQGWERGAFCMDRYYRGTPLDLGVTMGALSSENAKIEGLVQLVDIDDAQDTSFADRILDSIHKFALRETSSNPIYQYKLVDINTDTHGTVKALICAADPDNSLFLGGGQPVMLPDGTIEGLSLEEASAMIAASKGEPGASIRNTGIAYWQFVLDCTYKAGLEPEPHIKALVSKANYFRSLMPENERRELEALDNLGDERQKRENYDLRVFEMADESDPERGRWLLQHARNELKRMSGNQDPLHPDKARVIEENKIQLEELTR